MQMTDEQIARFWSKVDKAPGFGPKGECWIWTAALFKAGYGKLTINKKTYYAHRIAFLIAKGVDPHKGEACHKCDNPPCVNPDHIKIADHTFNIRECLQRGRMKHAFICGVFKNNAKLTDEIVQSIRDESPYGAARRRLAIRHGVSVSTINDIVLWRTWRNPSTKEVRPSIARR